MRTGTANLPLHPGRAPPWLFKRMVKLASAITEYVVQEYSPEEMLRRLSNPYWFTAFGCVLAFDWHSSGLTTTTCGALRLALDAETHGLYAAGGKGKASKRTPDQLRELEAFDLSEKKKDELIHASKMAAKVDNNLVQDGYQLYHHSFFVSEKGEWAVVQQGMNETYARRYHWLSDNVKSFVCDPQSAICCDEKVEQTLNLSSAKSAETQKTSLDLVRDNPVHLRKYFTHQASLLDFAEVSERTLAFNAPEHHPVWLTDISERGWQTLQHAYELQPENYEGLVALRGVGAATLRSLALISELVYGSQSSWEDPVKYSFANGGKDGYPYFPDKQRYDADTRLLTEAINNAKIGEREKYDAIRRLKDFV